MIRLIRLIALILAPSAFTPGIAYAQTNKTTVTTSTSSIQCNRSDAGECHFVLYTQECVEGPPASGKPTLVCTSKYWQEFSLRVGEVKVLQNPPPNFKQCAQVGKNKPVFPACAK